MSEQAIKHMFVCQTAHIIQRINDCSFDKVLQVGHQQFGSLEFQGLCGFLHCGMLKLKVELSC